MLKRMLGVSAAFWAGFELEVLPGWMSLALMLAFAIPMVQDIWDGVPQRQAQARILKIAERLESRLDAYEVRASMTKSDRVMQQIADSRSDLDPERMLSEILKQEDRDWLLEQVRLIHDERA